MKPADNWYFRLLLFTRIFIFLLHLAFFWIYNSPFHSAFVILLLLGGWGHICAGAIGSEVSVSLVVRVCRVTNHHCFGLLRLRRLNSRSRWRWWLDWIYSIWHSRIAWALRSIFNIFVNLAHINNGWVAHWLSRNTGVETLVSRVSFLLGWEPLLRVVRPRNGRLHPVFSCRIGVPTHIHARVCLVSQILARVYSTSFSLSCGFVRVGGASHSNSFLLLTWVAAWMVTCIRLREAFPSVHGGAIISGHAVTAIGQDHWVTNFMGLTSRLLVRSHSPGSVLGAKIRISGPLCDNWTSSCTCRRWRLWEPILSLSILLVVLASLLLVIMEGTTVL
jgi:hypothetical protein